MLRTRIIRYRNKWRNSIFLRKAGVAFQRFACLLARVKIRFYIAAIIVLFSIAITPQAVDAAYRFRGYEAIGGEALIIPMGIILAWLVCDIMKGYDLARERRKDIECTQNNCER